MIYRIADFNIDIIYSYENNDIFLEKYLAKEQSNPDFTVKVSEEDIDYELNNAVDVQKTLRYSRGYLERLAILRKVAANILMRGGFLMHGVAFEYEGKGYIFTAKSGVGKTTHAKLWQEYFGADKVEIINGDKPLIRKIDGKFYAYGTPWCGKEGYSTNSRMEICNICFITRSEENSIVKLEEEEALARLMAQVMILDSTDLATQFDLIGSVVESIPIYKLACNKSHGAVKVAYEGMK
ncbi:MAG: hypothetical protein IKY12_03875 [Clostridia bacterium]|nr:hypothetical protein [Clostridia bacterium]